MTISSIWSFPDRGPWGNGGWRGNCSGYIIRNLLEFYRPALFVDPAMGSGTSRDVAREMGVRFIGLDLHSGFNLLRDSLAERTGSDVDLVFFHPPYHNMVLYSGNVWGDAHPDDLSRCGSFDEFIEKLRIALINIYEALRKHGHYSVLIGDMRKDGVYRSFQSDIIQVAPGALESVVIKAQHNCASDRRSYGGAKFIPICHEYLLSFRKDRILIGLLACAMDTSRRLKSLSRSSWRSVVLWALRQLGGKGTLAQVYEAVAYGCEEKTRANPHWKEKVRQVLQQTALNISRGVWVLKEEQV